MVDKDMIDRCWDFSVIFLPRASYVLREESYVYRYCTYHRGGKYGRI